MTAPRPWLAHLGRPLELVNAAALALYRLGLRRSRRVQARVVSVGNIALGGTGKTPLVVAIVEALVAAGARPAVLTRGYRRSERQPLVVDNQPDVSWRQAGDEPIVVSRALPGVPVVVDEDRVAGAATAIRRNRATHLVLDDGFQHWRLARDLDIVVVDGRDPLCSRRPRREHPRALARADAVVITFFDDADAEEARREVAGVAPRAKLVVARVRPRWIHRGGRPEPAATLAGKRVLAAAGIAEPERFFATLRGLGAALVGAVRRPDHYAWRPEELEALLHAAAAKNAEVVVTAKDAVKVPDALAATIGWLEIRLEPEDGSLGELAIGRGARLPGGTQGTDVR